MKKNELYLILNSFFSKFETGPLQVNDTLMKNLKMKFCKTVIIKDVKIF